MTSAFLPSGPPQHSFGVPDWSSKLAWYIFVQFVGLYQTYVGPFDRIAWNESVRSRNPIPDYVGLPFFLLSGASVWSGWLCRRQITSPTQESSNESWMPLGGSIPSRTPLNTVRGNDLTTAPHRRHLLDPWFPAIYYEIAGLSRLFPPTGYPSSKIAGLPALLLRCLSPGTNQFNLGSRSGFLARRSESPWRPDNQNVCVRLKA